MKRTNVVIVACLLCVIGVGLGRYYDLSFFPIIAGLFALATLRRRKARYMVGVGLIVFGIGNRLDKRQWIFKSALL